MVSVGLIFAPIPGAQELFLALGSGVLPGSPLGSRFAIRNFNQGHNYHSCIQDKMLFQYYLAGSVYSLCTGWEDGELPKGYQKALKPLSPFLNQS